MGERSQTYTNMLSAKGEDQVLQQFEAVQDETQNETQDESQDLPITRQSLYLQVTTVLVLFQFSSMILHSLHVALLQKKR